MIDGRIAADSVIKLKAYILLLLFYSQKECKLRSRVILNWIRIMLVYSEKRLCEVLSQAFSETKWVFLLTGTSDRAWKKVVSGIFGISIGGRRTGRVLASAVDRKAGARGALASFSSTSPVTSGDEGVHRPRIEMWPS